MEIYKTTSNEINLVKYLQQSAGWPKAPKVTTEEESLAKNRRQFQLLHASFAVKYSSDVMNRETKVRLLPRLLMKKGMRHQGILLVFASSLTL